MSSLELLPAVDVKDGRAVRLVQGELSQESVYGSPLDVALDFQKAGAQWIHLVDLDAAFGRGENTALLAEVVGRLDIDVELSGGIRDDASLARALATGCRRVNLGTAALFSQRADGRKKVATSLRLFLVWNQMGAPVTSLQMSPRMERYKDLT